MARYFPDISVLSAAGVAGAVRVEGDRVDGAEVALHTTKLLLNMIYALKFQISA